MERRNRVESLVIHDREATSERRIPIEEEMEPYRSYLRMKSRVHNDEDSIPKIVASSSLSLTTLENAM